MEVILTEESVLFILESVNFIGYLVQESRCIDLVFSGFLRRNVQLDSHGFYELLCFSQSEFHQLIPFRVGRPAVKVEKFVGVTDYIDVSRRVLPCFAGVFVRLTTDFLHHVPGHPDDLHVIVQIVVRVIEEIREVTESLRLEALGQVTVQTTLIGLRYVRIHVSSCPQTYPVEDSFSLSSPVASHLLLRLRHVVL